MFSLLEIRGQSSQLHKSGSIEINTECYRQRRPAWLVLLKLLGVAGMVAVGAAISIPSLLEVEVPLGQAIVMTAIGMIVYTTIAFFIRPEANTDNLGFGGGMANDPFQCSDNVNRFLWRCHCVLGPGRFTADTLLDLCVLIGLMKNGDEHSHDAAHGAFPAISAGGAFDANKPITPLDPNRFQQSSGNFVAGQIQLDSQRFFQSQGAVAQGQPVKA
jgi:hypothetical protein